MTLTLELSPAAEENLRCRAIRAGVPLSDLASRLLETESFRETDTGKAETGAELVAQLEADGVIGAWADRDDITDSAKFARDLAGKPNTENGRHVEIVDSDILIDLLRGEPRTKAWLTSQAVHPYTTGFSAMELVQGSRDKTALKEAERLLSRFKRTWPSLIAAEQAFRYYGQLKLSHNLGLIDALIAATALENGAILYTFNVKHFTGFPGVDARAPYTK